MKFNVDEQTKFSVDEHKLKTDIFVTSSIDGKTTKKDVNIKFIGQCDLLVSALSYLRHQINDTYLSTIELNLQCMMSFVSGFHCYNDVESMDTMLGELLKKIYTLETKHKFRGLMAIGTTKKGALVHFVRAIARQTELYYLETIDGEPNDLQRYIAQYLNRLSTYLYDVALRYERNR